MQHIISNSKQLTVSCFHESNTPEGKNRKNSRNQRSEPICPDQHVEDNYRIICMHNRSKRGVGFLRSSRPVWDGTQLQERKQKGNNVFLNFCWNWHCTSVSPASETKISYHFTRGTNSDNSNGWARLMAHLLQVRQGRKLLQQLRLCPILCGRDVMHFLQMLVHTWVCAYKLLHFHSLGLTLCINLK